MKNGLFVKQGKAMTSSPGLGAGVVLLTSLLPLWGVPLGWIGLIILSLITFEQGYQKAVFAFLAAMVPVFINAANSQWAVMAHQLSLSVAAYGLAIVFARTRSWSLVIELLAALGLVVVLCLHWVHADITNWWLVSFMNYFQQLPADAELDMASAELVAQAISRFATGIQGATMMLSMLINLLLARVWWRHLRRESPQAVRTECLQVRVSWSMVVLLGVCAVLGLVMSMPAVIDALPLLVMPFFCAGLSIFHAIVQPVKHRLMKLVGFYVCLILLSPYSVLCIALAGLVDIGYDLRERALRRPK